MVISGDGVERRCGCALGETRVERGSIPIQGDRGREWGEWGGLGLRGGDKEREEGPAGPA